MDYICPRCRSTQKFALQRIPVEDGQEQLIFKCNACNWKKIALVGNSDTINAYRDIQRLRKKVRRVPALRRHLQRRIKQFNDHLRSDKDNS